MTVILKSAGAAIGAALVLTAVAGVANAGGFQVGQGAGPMKVTKAQLGIISPKTAACPTTAKMVGWILTTKPGLVKYRIRKISDGATDYKTIIVKKAASGKYMAQFSRKLKIHHKIKTKYRLEVKGHAAKSLWAPLHAPCLAFPPSKKLKAGS